jgi:hypothetical protein
MVQLKQKSLHGGCFTELEQREITKTSQIKK